MLVGTDDRPIDVVLLPIHLATRICPSLQLGQDTRPQPAALPPIGARGDGLPRPVAFGQVAPRCSSLGDPEYAVDDMSMIMEGAAAASRVARRHERRELCPLVIGQFMTSHVCHSTAFGKHALARDLTDARRRLI
jgi:hypothetical protein